MKRKVKPSRYCRSANNSRICARTDTSSEAVDRPASATQAPRPAPARCCTGSHGTPSMRSRACREATITASESPQPTSTTLRTSAASRSAMASRVVALRANVARIAAGWPNSSGPSPGRGSAASRPAGRCWAGPGCGHARRRTRAARPLAGEGRVGWCSDPAADWSRHSSDATARPWDTAQGILHLAIQKRYTVCVSGV